MAYSAKRRRMPAYLPITQEGWEAVCRYIDQALAYAADSNRPIPDESLLRVGLPQGSLLEITRDLGVRLNDTGPNGGLRSPRQFDAPTIALIRLLLAAGGSIGLNRKNMNTAYRKDYPHLRWVYEGKDAKVPLLRIIADTSPGDMTPAADNHYSLRRSDIRHRSTHASSIELTLDGCPTKHPYLGREHAIRFALYTLQRKKHRLTFSLPPASLERRLREALWLMDRIPLKEGGVMVPGLH